MPSCPVARPGAGARAGACPGLGLRRGLAYVPQERRRALPRDDPAHRPERQARLARGAVEAREA